METEVVRGLAPMQSAVQEKKGVMEKDGASWEWRDPNPTTGGGLETTRGLAPEEVHESE